MSNERCKFKHCNYSFVSATRKSPLEDAYDFLDSNYGRNIKIVILHTGPIFLLFYDFL